MTLNIQDLIHGLKKARQTKKLSQSALADQLGIPQSHLSKIEAGRIDIRLGSLLEMARTLDLELILVPRQDISLIKGLISSREKGRQGHTSEPAYSLADESSEQED
jgi:HTH-type transcriptional regulator / antitoxin HipB